MRALESRVLLKAGPRAVQERAASGSAGHWGVCGQRTTLNPVHKRKNTSTHVARTARQSRCSNYPQATRFATAPAPPSLTDRQSCACQSGDRWVWGHTAQILSSIMHPNKAGQAPTCVAVHMTPSWTCTAGPPCWPSRPLMTDHAMLSCCWLAAHTFRARLPQA